MSRLSLTQTNLPTGIFDSIALYQDGILITKRFIHSSMLGGI
jgi:hypothetical protein